MFHLPLLVTLNIHCTYSSLSHYVKYSKKSPASLLRCNSAVLFFLMHKESAMDKTPVFLSLLIVFVQRTSCFVENST